MLDLRGILNFKLLLWQRVLVGMICGILAGIYLKEQASKIEFLGIIFLNLIKMVIVPLIFFTIIYGITSVEDYQGLYRIGVKAIVVFVTTAMSAAIIGLITSHFLQPGLSAGSSGIRESLTQMVTKTSTNGNAAKSLFDILIGIIPTNIFAALAEGNILQIILFAFFCGIIMNSCKDSCNTLINLCHQIAQIMFKMISIIMLIAPLGVFGYMASLVGTQGVTVLVSLMKLIATILIGCIIQYLFFGIIIRSFGKISPVPFYKKMIGPQLLAFSTSSSKATLVPLMQVAEGKLGISKQNSRFLLPLSAALNMDGGAIYQSSCAIFFAQILGVHLSLMDYTTLIFMCTLASIGGAGIPGGVLLFLGMVLNSIGIPIEGVVLIASIDRILDMVTTLINVTGDACVTLIIDSSENTLDKKTYYS
ncbi:Proton/sodium-glutamate symport protein [Alphaproteobacteria bacterium]